MRAILAALLLLALAGPLTAQPAQNPLTFVQNGQWPQAQAAAARTGDPVAEKLIVYYRMLTPKAASAAEIHAFIRQNPDWPLPALLERRRADAIAADRDNTAVAALCTERKPLAMPANGPALFRCAEAMANLGRSQEAAALAREAWVLAISDPATEAAFPRRFPGLMTPTDQWARFQRLAWNDTAAAQRQIARLDPAQAERAAARLRLKQNGIGYAVRPGEEPGAVLDLARAYQQLNETAAAVALWRAAGPPAEKAAPAHLGAFWTERDRLVRKLLHDGDNAGAYAIVAAHSQTDPATVTEAEFLAGFIALRRLHDPQLAMHHFFALSHASPSVQTQARAFYWLGRAKTAAGIDGTEEYKHATAWPTTFHGQLAARAGGMADAALVRALLAPPTPTVGLADTPVAAELPRAANLLVSWGDARRARPFLLRMDDIAPKHIDRIAVGDFAAAMGLPDITVLISRRLSRDGIVPPMQGWPAPFEPPPVVEPAISLAVMRQESAFDAGVVSPAGARGLMQLMPATARLVARRLGEPASDALLTTNPKYNMLLGTTYLLEMLTRFDNSLPLAAAAYNAGPNRVTQWLTENGDPRAWDRSMIDWIELIPFNETRNYVQRVLENVVVYQTRRSGTLPAMMPQWSR